LRNVGHLVDVELVEAGGGISLGESMRARTLRQLLLLGEGKSCRAQRIAHLTTCGAITLQGPHQVAKQSRTTRVSLASSALSQSDFLRCDLRVSPCSCALVTSWDAVVALRRGRTRVRRSGGGSRCQVVHALLCHFASVMEESWVEDRSVEVQVRGFGDRKCRGCGCRARSGKQSPREQ
jgi:hypothetical protein